MKLWVKRVGIISATALYETRYDAFSGVGLIAFSNSEWDNFGLPMPKSYKPFQVNVSAGIVSPTKRKTKNSIILWAAQCEDYVALYQRKPADNFHDSWAITTICNKWWKKLKFPVLSAPWRLNIFRVKINIKPVKPIEE